MSAAQKAENPPESAMQTPQRFKIPMRYIQIATAVYFDLTRVDLIGPKRNQMYVYPRRIAMFICRIHCDKSYPEIAIAFGNRDHTSVREGVLAIQDGLDDEVRCICMEILMVAKKGWHHKKERIKTAFDDDNITAIGLEFQDD